MEPKCIKEQLEYKMQVIFLDVTFYYNHTRNVHNQNKECIDLILNNLYYRKNGKIMLKISLGRRLLSVILTTMLPTAIIVIVALSTNYYNTDHHFKTIIPVNLTCLLMMVTMSIGVSASLPKTGFSSTPRI